MLPLIENLAITRKGANNFLEKINSKLKRFYNKKYGNVKISMQLDEYEWNNFFGDVHI